MFHHSSELTIFRHENCRRQGSCAYFGSNMKNEGLMNNSLKNPLKWRIALPVTTVLTVFLLSGCAPKVLPISFFQQDKLADLDNESIFADQPTMVEPLSMYDAMARAIHFNLNYRLKRMETAVASGEAKMANLDMLPNLTVAAGYSVRNSLSASYSRNVATGSRSSEATTSSGRQSITSDLAMSWNLLDFGVSYFQARQAKNKHLIQDELRRKALHNLLKDVRTAFWKAMATQEMEREISLLLATAEDALIIAKNVEDKGYKSPVDTLQYQIGMLDIIRQLEKARAEMLVAREDLASMINLPPGVTLKLLDDSGRMSNALKPELIELEGLERFALASRPELRLEHYQDRIEADETRKAIARLFPGLEINLGGNYDYNPLLVHQRWVQAGTRLSWNIIQLLKKADSDDLFSTREKTIETRRLAQHMAIVTQSRIAFHEFHLAQRNLKLTNREEGVRGQLKEYIGNRSRLGLDSQLKYVRSAAEATLGRVRQYESYSRYQNALGNIYATMGMDIVPENTMEPDLQMLARTLRGEMHDWENTYLANKSNSTVIGKAELPLKSIEAILDARRARKIATASVQARDARVNKKTVLSVPSAQVVEPKTVTIERLENLTTEIITNNITMAMVGAIPDAVRKSVSIPIPKPSPKMKIVIKQAFAKLPIPTPHPRANRKNNPITSFEKRFNVQVAAFADQQHPELHINLMNQLRKRGYEPLLREMRTVDGTDWRYVWLGSYVTKSEAMTVRDNFKRKEGKDAFITVQVTP
jgi:outer membrane protein, multidrug efflux system